MPAVGTLPPLGPGGLARVQARTCSPLYGWLSAELFVQALKNAGSDPSRGSLLQALSKITSFNGNDFIAPTNPAAKTPPNCYLIATVTNGQFVRSPDNPPITGSTNGFRCDGSYIVSPAPERPSAGTRRVVAGSDGGRS